MLLRELRQIFATVCGPCGIWYSCFICYFFSTFVIAKGRIQDYSKEGVVSMRVQGERPRAKGMEEGEGGRERVMFVDFLHFDFRGINLSNVRHYNKD